jgi:hypothetical protein
MNTCGSEAGDTLCYSAYVFRIIEASKTISTFLDQQNYVNAVKTGNRRYYEIIV